MNLMIKKAMIFVNIYCVPGTNLETLHKIVLNPRDKVGSVVFNFSDKQNKTKTEAQQV